MAMRWARPRCMMVFLILQIRSGAKVLKPWYGCGVSEMCTLSNVYTELSDSKIDWRSTEEYLGTAGRGWSVCRAKEGRTYACRLWAYRGGRDRSSGPIRRVHCVKAIEWWLLKRHQQAKQMHWLTSSLIPRPFSIKLGLVHLYSTILNKILLHCMVANLINQWIENKNKMPPPSLFFLEIDGWELKK